MIAGVQQDAQSIFELRSMLDGGATDEDILNHISRKIQNGNGSKALYESGVILADQGRDEFIGDLSKGEQRLKTFQGSGLIDLPAFKQDRVQSSSQTPAGTRIITSSGQTKFIPASEEELIGNARIDAENLARAKQSKLELERGISDTKVREAKLKEVNKERGLYAKGFRERADNARAAIPQLDKIIKLLPNVDTGNLAKAKLIVKRALNVDVSNEETFLSLTSNLVRQAAESIKGALSDKDLQFLEATQPNIGNSVEGNLKILNDLRSLAAHSIGVNKQFKSFSKNSKNDILDFEAPLFFTDTSGKAAMSPEEKAARKEELKAELRRGRATN